MRKNTVTTLWILGILMCLAQIWLPGYYLTGDGPCHLYNAQIVHDIWNGQNIRFYKSYFDILYQPDPNWYATAIFALLLFIVKGVFVEKIVLTIYMAMYLAGFQRLLKKINPNVGLWPLVIFFFLFPHTLAKGFYNFSFSIAFYFWMVWAWIGFLEKNTIWKAVRFFLFTILVYFSHLMSFEFGVFTCFSILVSWAYCIKANNTSVQPIFYFLKQFGFLALLLLPFLLLMVSFSDKQGGMQLQLQHHFYRMEELLRFKYAVSSSSLEVPFAILASVIIVIMLGISICKFCNNWKPGPFYGLIICFLGLLFVYIFFPESFLGRLILITMRVQPYLFVIMASIVAMITKPGKLLNIAAIIIFMCFIGMGISRINVGLRSSRAIDDILSARSYIKPNSVVLPLNFSLNGKDADGKIIGDNNWLFCHVTDYLGLEKPLIILDNYEANMGYFPVRWKEDKNPYWHLATFDGIEAVPPSADIAAYKNKSGVDIDYIIFWCWESKWLEDPHFNTLYHQLNKNYHLVFSSSTNRTMLYQRN